MTVGGQQGPFNMILLSFISYHGDLVILYLESVNRGLKLQVTKTVYIFIYFTESVNNSGSLTFLYQHVLEKQRNKKKSRKKVAEIISFVLVLLGL